MRQLLPLSAVRVFEAAARHENFTAAAEELGMTQAAVSYQIRLIEDRLGQKLFRREKQRVILSDAGRRAAAGVGRGLDEIEAAFADLRADDEGTLGITTTVTFANTWLAWRLGGFQLAHPDIAVRLTADNGVADLSAAGFDIAVRGGRGPWPGLEAHRLLLQDFTPMCSPAFLDAQGGTITPRDLLRLPLISPHDPTWLRWLDEAGLTDVAAADLQGVRLDTQANDGHAAMAGQGVAMLTPFFWKNDMADGRLVQLFPQVSTLGEAYWLVYPEHRGRVAKIRRFREWLVEELANGGRPKVL
jgi:LysR family glycine cleavage system transcriptional activator